MKFQTRYRLERIARRSLYALLSLMAMTTLFFVLAPVFSSDPDRLPALYEARSWCLESIGVGFILTLMATALLVLVVEGLNKLLAKFTRYWGGLPTGVTQWTYSVVPACVFGLVVLIGFANALYLFLHAPSISLLRVTHLDAIKITETGLKGAGVYSFRRPDARVVDGYLALDRNVIRLGVPIRSVFAQDIGTVSDIEKSGHDLFVIVGRRLLSVDDSEATQIAELPMSGMRFGRRVYDDGLASELLLTGNENGHGLVYALYHDGTYAKLADADTNVVGAAGCMDRTAVAYDDYVLRLQAGFRPRLLFRVPQSSGPITSIAARLAHGAGVGDCLWLVATRNGVYSIQNGAAALLIAGAGGNLSVVEDDPLGFEVTDPRRNVAFLASFIK